MPGMHVITPSQDSTTTTPNAVMTTLAAPSSGSTELSTWRVSMRTDARGPEHALDREQVWMPLSGALEVTCEGRVEKVETGQALVVPAGVLRQFGAPFGDVEALVAMRAGGIVSVPGGETRPLPWAQ